MKKSVLFRTALIMLVLTMVSSCFVGGTFAKYVTSNSGSDTAQVAKFGVQINVSDDLGLFATEYAKEDDEYTGTLSVQSQTGSQLVAPGTKGSMSFNITGMPEVATRVSVEFGEDCKAIQLTAGTYTLPAGQFKAEQTEVTIENAYEPIKFYFGTEAINDSTSYTMTLTQLQNEMDNVFTKDYDPGHNFGENGLTYYLGWCWAFEDASIENVNFLDTYLGNEAVSTPQQEILNFEIVVEQID